MAKHKTLYYAVAFHYNDEPPHSHYEAWVSVGGQPKVGSPEDEQTMYHFSHEEWIPVLAKVAKGKPTSPAGSDFTIVKIVGADLP